MLLICSLHTLQLCGVLRLFWIWILSPANRKNFNSSFTYLNALHFFLLCSFPKTPSTMLRKSTKSGHPVLLQKSHWVWSMMLAMGLSYRLYCVMFLLYLICWWVLSWRHVEFCWFFFLSVGMIIWFSSFILLMWDVDYWFAYNEPSLQCWDKFHLLVVYDQSDTQSNLVCNTMFRIFASSESWSAL
jgi:hypothetical protein